MSLTDASDPSGFEPELERLFERYVPDMASHWTRASDHDISTLEGIAGGALPRCYQWMLRRLGRGCSDIVYGSLDLSAQAIVQGHARNAFPEQEGMMCFAIDTDTFQPQLRYYDLAHATDGDAPVIVVGPEDDEEVATEYESLREFLGTAVFNAHRIRTSAARVEGVFFSEEGSSAIGELEPFLEGLGFTAPLPTGRYCALYDDGDIALWSSRKPSEDLRSDLLPFQLGGSSEGELRKFLGLLSASTSLRGHHLRWQTTTA